MKPEETAINLCNCNQTMALDAKAIALALHLPSVPSVHTELCRRQVGDFLAAAGSGDSVVACTQEAPLFCELAGQAGLKSEIKFVNIRETAGWSAQSKGATAKIAALLAMAQLPEPEPVPGISYQSAGQLLIIGPAEIAVQWAERLKDQLEVNVLATTSTGAELPPVRGYPVWSGKSISVSGYLGAFEVAWEQSNPIDLEVCTRCNACIRACPEQAIDLTYQIDMSRCKSSRDCVKACGDIRAIDFNRTDVARSDSFDLVLDLTEDQLIKLSQPPQGYLAPGRDPLEQALAAGKLVRLVGEFEKPKFFSYNPKICAHSRSSKAGCNNCIDTCSTGAITSDGDHVKVEPHLCMGCGGCATVCPSGAMTHAHPRVTDMGRRIKTILGTYRDAGGKDACILFHNAEVSRDLISRLARRGKGLPARVIPLETLHVASIGMDTLLGAMAYGASQVVLLASEHEADAYGDAVRGQMRHAQTVLSALGFSGEHFRMLVPGDVAEFEREIWALEPATTVSRAAAFNLGLEKRTTLEFAIEHLLSQAASPQDEIALKKGAPWGRVNVNTASCTMCMSCVGACPESALLDGRETPMLKFIERNCVQCGLCANTCPEGAITLTPRLLLTPQAKSEQVLNEAVPFNCVRCGKPFGTRQMVDNMLGKLGTHSMFAGGGLKRLQMCADCRVVDMMENKNEMSIHDIR